MVKVFAFDFDGTLADTKAFYVRCIKQALEEAGVAITQADVAEHLVPTIMGTIESICRDLGTDRPDPLRTVERVIALTATESIGDIGSCSGAREALDWAWNEHGGAWLVTNSHGTFAGRVLERHGIAGRFMGMHTLDTTGGDKAEGLRRVLEATGATREELVYVGDTSQDVEAANSCGCLSAVVFSETSWDWPDDSKLKSMGPDYFVDSLLELKASL